MCLGNVCGVNIEDHNCLLLVWKSVPERDPFLCNSKHLKNVYNCFLRNVLSVKKKKFESCTRRVWKMGRKAVERGANLCKCVHSTKVLSM